MDPSLLVTALVPTALLIAFGAVLRHRSGLGESFWRGAEGLTYNVLLPALFVVTLARADFGAVRVPTMVAVLAGTTAAGALVTVLLRPLAGGDGPAFTSVFQGAIRFNNYVGLVIASTLFGDHGVALAALTNATLVPIVNVLSTVVLARHGHAALRGRAVVRAIATNPLVVSCLLGLGLNLLAGSSWAGWLASPVPAGLLAVASASLAVLGQAALPLGLLCVGSGLRRPEGHGQTRPTIVSTLIRLVAMPALGIGLARALGLSGDAALVAVVFLSLPTASSAYVLARRLGGDAPLMASITAVQTVLALALLPGWVLLGRSLLG